MIQDEYMRGCGRAIKEMDEDMSSLVMGILIKVSFRTAKHMVKELISGRMVKSMMVSGKKVRSKGMVFGKEFMEIAI